MPIKLAIFDWDGTLVDSAVRIVECLDAAARDLGFSPLPPERLRKVIGLSLGVAADTLWPKASRAQRAAWVKRYGAHFSRFAGAAMPLFPGVEACLQAMHAQGYLLAVSTGKSRRGLERGLRDNDLTHLFSATRCADEAPSKPHPQMILDILSETGIDADDAVMVGDTVFDLQMAKCAEVRALAVTYGAHAVGDLQACNPEVCANSFQEVYEWIRARTGL